jgi:2-polyprenyl-3-methyl-5-hydroxy-6-metoxy-1,4-benzoquinol methylase
MKKKILFNKKEICGDKKLSLKQRILYLWFNFLNNILSNSSQLKCEKVFVKNYSIIDNSSPSRFLTDQFINYELPKLLPKEKINVLEFGCGSGSLCKKLSNLNYSGEYTGIDIKNNFKLDKVKNFNHSFIQIDANNYNSGKKQFDLIISITALEHIKNDKLVIDKIPSMISKGGIDVHIVPSSWALPTYLWHGYRQYTLNRIENIFGKKNIRVFALGGIFSFFLHFFIITIFEILLKFKIRKILPSLYKFLLRLSLYFDCFFPYLSTSYVIVRKRS